MPENSLSQPPLQVGAGVGLGLLRSDMPARDVPLDKQHRTRAGRSVGPALDGAVGGAFWERAGSLGQLVHKSWVSC